VRFAWLALVLIACGSSSAGSEPGSSSGGTSSGSFGVDGGLGVLDANGCSAAAALVYVVSADNDLYSFDPNSTTFTKAGHLACPAGDATPNSMAIDRSGIAWVNYTDGSLFKVSTADASCTATKFAPNQIDGFTRFGMAFSTNGPKSTQETLYVVGLDTSQVGIGHGLGAITLDDMKLHFLGDFTDPLKGKGAELTGTGDGKLYGFFTTAPTATLALINGLSGATSKNESLAAVNTGQSYAFSFYGGDFYFYTAPSNTSSSTLSRLHTKTSQVEVVKQDVGGFRIVGAGVSTCAPLDGPK
jgi:hypothetical protein